MRSIIKAVSYSIPSSAVHEWAAACFIRLKHRILLLFLGIALGVALTIPASVDARIYKYKKNGVWVYTDTPSEDMPTDHQAVPSSGTETPHNTPPKERLLLVGYPAATSIERAVACTVGIENAMGSGSGFFISSKGHILTNKHVIRSTANQVDRTQKRIAQVEAQITQLSTHLSKEKERLLNFKAQLDQLESIVQSESNPARKRTYQANYEVKRTQYQQWEDDFNLRQAKFEREKNRFESKRSNFEYARSVTDLSQSFSITLADNTRYYARVIKVSAMHDLALLKLDGYQTPTLSPAIDREITQGDPVYAIGNPARLKNSVTSGVFSGYEGGFAKTDAKIYPGNSGGPLVTQKGQVIGINTFKKLTHKFEGLGFAIPIRQALDEFSSYLP